MVTTHMQPKKRWVCSLEHKTIMTTNSRSFVFIVVPSLHTKTPYGGIKIRKRWWHTHNHLLFKKLLFVDEKKTMKWNSHGKHIEDVNELECAPSLCNNYNEATTWKKKKRIDLPTNHFCSNPWYNLLLQQ